MSDAVYLSAILAMWKYTRLAIVRLAVGTWSLMSRSCPQTLTTAQHVGNAPYQREFLLLCAHDMDFSATLGGALDGNSGITTAYVPPPIPKGTYDYGAGFYDPLTEQIMSYDGKQVLGYVGEVEEKWIKDHCRKGFEDVKFPGMEGESPDAGPSEG
ncbi:morn5 [Symbiodinium natans]|uniref:Morn5 protein n=1 Tax=Symbiodinium natans TaxID=878477 RepID=A0A812R4R8_9DINO|nr:morn5 [Symbiodinium natans]